MIKRICWYFRWGWKMSHSHCTDTNVEEVWVNQKTGEKKVVFRSILSTWWE